MFNDSTQKHLKSYVYGLRDPRNKRYFYIGYGTGNRVFQHIQEARNDAKASEKIKTIREILDSGLEVQYDIIRHGMDEKEGRQVEAALIDAFQLEKLTNQVRGHGSREFGLMSSVEISLLYKSEPFLFNEPAIGLKINQRWFRGISATDLYESARRAWIIGGNVRDRARYAVAISFGVVRALYKIDLWCPFEKSREGKAYVNKKGQAITKWGFVGLADSNYDSLIGTDISGYRNAQGQNPYFIIN